MVPLTPSQTVRVGSLTTGVVEVSTVIFKLTSAPIGCPAKPPDIRVLVVTAPVKEYCSTAAFADGASARTPTARALDSRTNRSLLDPREQGRRRVRPGRVRSGSPEASVMPNRGRATGFPGIPDAPRRATRRRRA